MLAIPPIINVATMMKLGDEISSRTYIRTSTPIDSKTDPGVLRDLLIRFLKRYIVCKNVVLETIL